MFKRQFKGVMSISQLIGMVIVAVILGALIGTVADNTIGKQSTGNITGTTSVLLGLVPLFLIIAIVVSYVRGIKG